jgi:hypothetical protein
MWQTIAITLPRLATGLLDNQVLSMRVPLAEGRHICLSRLHTPCLGLPTGMDPPFTSSRRTTQGVCRQATGWNPVTPRALSAFISGIRGAKPAPEKAYDTCQMHIIRVRDRYTTTY